MEIDPLLTDLYEKKQSLRNGVMALTSELSDVRARLAHQEHCYVNESRTRQAAETKVKTMEAQCTQLLKELDVKNRSLKEHEAKVNKLTEQLDLLQRDLQEQHKAKEDLKKRILKLEEPRAQTKKSSLQSLMNEEREND